MVINNAHRIPSVGLAAAPASAVTAPNPPVTTPSASVDGLARIDIASCPVHLTDRARALQIIAEAAGGRHDRPLGVASINLDHVHHFGEGRWKLGAADRAGGQASVEWLSLIDGAPIARQVQRMTGTDYPRLAGSDLISGILHDASAAGLSVAIVGGAPELAPVLADRLAADWPGVHFAGQWAPDRADLEVPERSLQIATQIRAAGADIVIVCLGKPRQEKWIDSYGSATGAGVLLAFGAVVDFLAGRVSRAPAWISAAGGEWMWRLILEPRRLARRYLLEGPPAYLALRHSQGPQRV